MKIGVGIGVPFVGKAGEAFTPANLFLNGEQGVWYDASDLSTLFQDAAGTTPVTAVGQPIGLHLDKSGNGNHRVQTDTAKRPTLGQDANGKYFILYDGASRFLVTENPVDFTATDEMSSFVGVRKLSDALQATVFELSPSATSGNPGTFTLQAPSGPAADTYRYTGGGTTSRSSSWTGYPAPTTNVVTYLQKISGPLIQPRIDTQAGNPNVTEQGTGNFGTYQIFFGSRNGTTFFFNGREYQTVICGRICTPSEISRTEKFINSRTKAYWKPSNTTAPVVSGTPYVGQTLTTTDGTWDAAPAVSGYTYQWLSNGQSVGTNANTYTLVASDFGKSVSCRVTATNPIGSSSSDSNALGPVAGLLPANTSPPSIAGDNPVGSTLTVTPGTWTGAPTPSITRQWLRDGNAISGQTGLTYVSQPADDGLPVSCRETATNSVGTANAVSNSIEVGDVAVLTLIEDGLDQDPPFYSFSSTRAGTLRWDFHSSATPPAGGEGDHLTGTQEISSGITVWDTDLSEAAGKTGYLHFRVGMSNILTSQQITVPGEGTGPTDGLLLEDGTSFYLQEDGTSYLTQESA